MPGSDPAEAMLDCLAKERACLLRGELAELASLAERKEALADTLAGPGWNAPRETIESVRQRAVENARLLEAALGVVAQVRHRIEELRRLRHGLETYGPEGGRRHVETHRGRMERRA